MAMGLGICGTSGSGSAASYVRPYDWPALPVAAANQVYILAAALPTGNNYAALNVTVVGGYTVDWGDGSIVNYASAVQAEHTFVYSTMTTPVTSRGYKTSIVKITPQVAGNAITVMNFCSKSSSFGTSVPGSNLWLEIGANVPSCTSMTVSGTPNSWFLEVFNLYACGAITNLAGFFNNCTSLSQFSLPAGFGSTATTMASFMRLCVNITSFTSPSGMGTLATNMGLFFQGCTALKSITLGASFGAAATDISNFFDTCTSLTSLTLPAGFGGATLNVIGTFASCNALEYITFPAGFGQSATDMTSAFTSCVSLKKLTFPANFGTGVTIVTTMFNNCQSLEEISFTTAFGGTITTTTNTFASCPSLRSLVNFAAPVSFSLAASSFGSTELNAVYTALPTVVGQTLTVSANYGYAGSTTAIATGKGWVMA